MPIGMDIYISGAQHTPPSPKEKCAGRTKDFMKICCVKSVKTRWSWRPGLTRRVCENPSVAGKWEDIKTAHELPADGPGVPTDFSSKKTGWSISHPEAYAMEEISLPR